MIYPHDMQLEFGAPWDDWSSSDWIRTKEPSVSCGTGVLHHLACEEDATETVLRHHASLKPPVLPRYHWAVRKHLHHNPQSLPRRVEKEIIFSKSTNLQC